MLSSQKTRRTHTTWEPTYAPHVRKVVGKPFTAITERQCLFPRPLRLSTIDRTVVKRFRHPLILRFILDRQLRHLKDVLQYLFLFFFLEGGRGLCDFRGLSPRVNPCDEDLVHV